VTAHDVLLAISTSASPEVALAENERAIAIAAPGQALESLLPTIVRALDEFGAALDDVRRIAVCTGPGSFTGLRIGVAFAKTLAQSSLRRIVGVSAFDVAQAGGPRETFPNAAIVMGKRDFYYARIVPSPEAEPQFANGNAAEISAALERCGVRPVEFARRLFAGAPGERALRVASIGRQRFASGTAGDWRDVVIDYGQRPNAVVNWEKRQNRRGGAPANAAKPSRQ